VADHDVMSGQPRQAAPEAPRSDEQIDPERIQIGRVIEAKDEVVT
jgi:hypothetical protein